MKSTQINSNKFDPTDNPSLPGDPESLLTEQQASQFLNFTPRALQSWRQRGGGPNFIRISARAVRYRKRDLIEWIGQRVQRNTSAA